MGLKILSAKEFNVRLKCTIHATGKLGFTEATAERLVLSEESGIKFAQDDEDHSILYLINSKRKDEDSFPVSKAGAYYNVNAKTLFDKLAFNYIDNIISFEMVEVNIDDVNDEIYKLIKKEKPRKE